MSETQPTIHPTAGPRPGGGKRGRIRLLQSVILLFFVSIGLRLVQIQIVESNTYRKIAQRQYQARIDLPATRGTLYDRNSNVIASNSMYVSFAADPQLAADDMRSIASTFSRVFGKPRNAYLEKLRTDSRFVWLERQVTTDYLKRVNMKQLDGIVLRYEPKRLYFHDQVAGQIVGTTNIDNAGLAGIELEFNQQLSGTDGYVILQRDGLGRARPSVDYPRVEPVNGHNITLTLDLALQAIAQRELRQGVETNHADGGIVIILQPRTGEVLAMAQFPEIDPNTFNKYPLQDQKLRAVTDLFEPGSVFKIVTASAALENHLVTPEKIFFAENGTYVVPGRPRPITDAHKEGWITFRQAVEFSSNIVMAKVSDLIGSERLYKMARDYGFGIATDIDFPGEVPGALKKPVDWWGTTLNTLAYGYEVGVTPLQLAAAYAAVANDGVLMKPYLLKRETDASNQALRESYPQPIRRVISSATAATLRDIFEGVVQEGTGKPAQIDGMRVAGKTGTSRKYVEGHYESGSYTASFVGFFPAQDPQIVCLVMIDNPRGGSYYGGTVSAPVFRSIAQQIINTTEIIAPPQSAVAQTVQPVSRPVSLPRVGTTGAASPSSPGTVPDLKGYSVRRAVSILSSAKLAPVISGSGVVVNQIPQPGAPAETGMTITLICQPKSTAALEAR